MIEGLRLKNFKAFDELEMTFQRLNLLAGLNGSGKSTVLQALGLLRQSFDERFLHENSLVLNGDLVTLGTGRDVLFQDFVDPKIEIGLDIKTNGFEGTFAWDIDPTLDSDVLQCNANNRISDWWPVHLFTEGFQFLRADRITPTATFPKSQHAVRQNEFLGPCGEFTAHFLLEFGEQFTTSEKMRHPDEPKAASLLAQVNAWMQEFSPGVRVEPTPVPMTDLVRLVFSYRGEGSAYGDVLRPHNVGFGLTHALPVLTACLSAKPDTILIIENPEAQLHPRGQSVIGRLLALSAANGAQVIVETHSDHILNGIRLAVKDGVIPPEECRINFFSRKPGLSSEHECPMLGSDGRLSYWPTGFFDQWERSLDQLLD